MARYIDADLLSVPVEFVKNHIIVGVSDFLSGYFKVLDAMLEFVAKIPTADVAEVRHGRWKEHFSFGCWHYDCPFCDDGYATKEKDKTPPNFCQNCGAKMDGKGDDHETL
jgi:hypothetical protein